MTKDEIDDIVCEIMAWDGPDGHIDGHELITSFILAVQAGKGKQWFHRYAGQKAS